jgi:hypothetical protein
MLKPIRLAAVLLICAALLSATVSSFSSSMVFQSPLAVTAPGLLAVASYSVLAGQTVTNLGPTIVSGDLGVSPGSAVTGFPPGLVGPPGKIHAADAHAAAAQVDNTATFGFLDQPCDVTYPGVQDLSLVSPLGPGVYCALGSFALTKNLTLTGSGVWIFKSASTLITSPGSSVTGGDPCNVWWRVVSSATLDTTTSFIGNILALTSITLNTGASLNGRALAQTGAVTMHSNTVGPVVCAAAPPPGTPAPENTSVPGPANTSVPGPANTSVPGPTSTLVATPTKMPTAAPAVVGLPRTGGAAPQGGASPWILVLIASVVGSLGALAFGLSIRAHRPTRR